MEFYEKIADKFNERYSGNDFDYAEKFLSGISAGGKILEVGCGTCRWSKVFNGKIYGIDASIEMLKQSGNECGKVCAFAENLPFPSKKFDLIYIVHALHQFNDKIQTLKEIFRVLKNGATLAIITVDFFNPEYYWYVNEFFPRASDIDKGRFLSAPKLKSALSYLGFAEIKSGIIHVTQKEFVGEEIFNDKFLKKHNVSQLAALSDAEYAKGIERIKKSINENPRKKFVVNIPVLGIRAIKKPSA